MNLPEIKYQAVFYVEGTKVKYEYNPMIRRSGYTAPEGSYTIQDRYGIWVCKDFMPIKRVNEWITSKGTEYTKLHAFINCQGLRLPANRGSFENTPSGMPRISLQETVPGLRWPVRRMVYGSYYGRGRSDRGSQEFPSLPGCKPEECKPSQCG